VNYPGTGHVGLVTSKLEKISFEGLKLLY
jgi:hypothetical protein